MKKILWICCGLLVVAGCAGQRKPVKLPEYTNIPIVRGKGALMKYRACSGSSRRGDIAIVAPVIEEGLRFRGVDVMVDMNRGYRRTRAPRHDLKVLVCLTRVTERRSVFGNLYAYTSRSIVHIRMVDRNGSVVAASIGEVAFVSEVGGGYHSRNGEWSGAFRHAAELAVRRLR